MAIHALTMAEGSPRPICIFDAVVARRTLIFCQCAGILIYNPASKYPRKFLNISTEAQTSPAPKSQLSDPNLLCIHFRTEQAFPSAQTPDIHSFHFI